ncbi:MAG: FtsX-like permease family protein [Candidatus Bathyarchaeia archaeon]|nr:ABC transporter permease [Candidatus Bathyarchaeota archaeon]
MNILELSKMASSALSERKLRTGLTILMVVIGSTLITSLNGLNAGASRFISDQLSTLGGNILIISPSASMGSFGPPRESAKIPLTSQTVRTLERLRWVDEVIPFISGVVTIQIGGEEKTVTVVGMDQGKLRYVAPKAELLKGKLASSSDFIGMVLGYKVAYEGDESKVKPGQTVKVKVNRVELVGGLQRVSVEEKAFQVRGILKELGNMLFDAQVYVSLPAAKAVLDKGNEYDGIYVVTRDSKYNGDVEDEIRRIYGKNIGVTSPKAIAETISNILGTFNAYISSIALVSLLVGAVGIVTTLFTSVMERTREIGLLKALGFSNPSILLMFLVESMLIGGIGGILGIAVGVVGAHLLAKLVPFGVSGITPVFKPVEMAYIWVISFILSIIAGLYPAWRASKLSPLEALRKE